MIDVYHMKQHDHNYNYLQLHFVAYDYLHFVCNYP